MELGLSETQEMIRASARDFLSERASPEFVRAMAADESGFTPDYWRDVAALGWTGLTLPEEYGGVGMSFTDMAVLLEEWGASLAPGPLFESTVISASAIERFGTDQQRAELLPGIAAGETIATIAMHEEHPAWAPSSVLATAVRSGNGWVLSGEKRFVPYGGSADCLLVLARSGDAPQDVSAFLVRNDSNSGIETTPMRVASGTPMASVSLNEIEVPAAGLLGAEGAGSAIIEWALERGAAARAVQLAGLGRRVVDETVAFVSERKQFGRPVGSFQAIQHYLADMASAVRSTRHLAYRGVWQISEGVPAVASVARAKIAANESIPDVCWTAHQSHGAIGFTWEHDLHLYTRRAISWRTEYGDTALHRARLANHLGL